MLTEPRRRTSVSERSSAFRPATSSAVMDCTLPGYFSTGIPSAGSGVAPMTVIPGSSIGAFVSEFSGSVDGACAAAGDRARRTSRTESTIIDMNGSPPTRFPRPGGSSRGGAYGDEGGDPQPLDGDDRHVVRSAIRDVGPLTARVDDDPLGLGKRAVQLEGGADGALRPI